MNKLSYFVNNLLKRKKKEKANENIQSVTFKLKLNGFAVKPPVKVPEFISIRDVLNNCNIVHDLKGKLVMSTKPPEQSIIAALGNSLIGALYDAYKNHYAISIRPDDVWLTIIIELADYIDKHAEEMRYLFVNHEGKKKLTVISNAAGDFSRLTKIMSDLIGENTKDNLRDFIEPQFTTTTPNDSLIARVALMGTVKNYFKYEFLLVCGIPQVTLMGTIGDWIKLKEKIIELGKRFAENQPELGWWSNILVPIADKFIKSYNGNPNDNFWQSCIDFHAARGLPSCINPNNKRKPSYLTGWALAFSPFFEGQWRLNKPEKILKSGSYGKVPSHQSKLSVVKVDIELNGKNACFYAGSIVNTYQNDTNTIRPNFDFAMFMIP
ncbi:uncharacterized protein LOC124810505 [Hydra vulgaris]|uniref:uncharacterized protein LOC124810505 n=1 Tax=Hydra vulgaris TaxID=6087 RepID=UPI001F5F55A2|nr:uncharacterized protein LOC124810505 [Hydra vulgaris]XP_047131444.1 uncharacterized protein LOC124810505 [Hydra vulgaris]